MPEIKEIIDSINASLYRFLRTTYNNDTNIIVNKNNKNYTNIKYSDIDTPSHESSNLNGNTANATPHIKSFAPYIVGISLTLGLLTFIISTASIITYIQKRNRKVNKKKKLILIINKLLNIYIYIQLHEYIHYYYIFFFE